MEAEDAPRNKKPSTINFSYHDPGRTFDGTPYEAAGKSVEQTANVVNLLRRAIADTAVQVRNAYMQRRLDTEGDTGIEEWPDSPEAKMLGQFARTAVLMKKKLSALHRASTYDPTQADKD